MKRLFLFRRKKISNFTINIHANILQILKNIIYIKTLIINYIKNIELIKKTARTIKMRRFFI